MQAPDEGTPIQSPNNPTIIVKPEDIIVVKQDEIVGPQPSPEAPQSMIDAPINEHPELEEI